MEEKIKIKNLHKSFNKIEVLKGIDLTVKEGEVVCIIGPSGSGKSTMLRCINLLEVPTKGEIIVDDYDITAKKANLNLIRRNIGMVFQQFNLFPHLTVLNNITMAPVDTKTMSKPEAEKLAMELLERVGLADKAHSFPSQLSGGQQQRVSIARALVGEPSVILADEPTGALDSHTGREVMQFLRQLNEEGNTIVLITHDNSIAAQAKRIVRITDGHIVYDGLVSGDKTVSSLDRAGIEEGET